MDTRQIAVGLALTLFEPEDLHKMVAHRDVMKIKKLIG